VPGPARRPRVAGARRPAPTPPAQQTAPEPAPAEVPAAQAPAVPPAAQGPGPGLLVVGRVGKPQGIRGEVTVEVRTDDPAARFADGAVLLTEPVERGPLTVASTRDQNARLVVLFEGVADRNGAEALRGTLLQVDGATLPPPDDPDEFHDFQLVGLVAELTSGAVVGRVREVLHLPHGDVLVVQRTDEAAPGSAAEALVPFVKAMVPVVDVAGGRVVLDPPEGLLTLSDPAEDDETPDGEPG
jgi:16S rRNA processing protein RimM